MERNALSPKKVKDTNIPRSSPVTSCPSSPVKLARLSMMHTSPRRLSMSPVKPLSAPGSPRKISRHSSPLTRPATALRIRPSPLKVYSSSDLYSTKLHVQISRDDDLVLKPPTEARISPSPSKRKLAFDTMRAPVRVSEHERIQLGILSNVQPRARELSPSPFNAPENAFLTPPRPRIGSILRPDDHLTKSVSPRLCSASDRAGDNGFTIFVDRSIYYATVNTVYDYGEDVNKENDWKTAVYVS